MTTQNAPKEASIESIEIQTASNPLYSLVWLHGLGADGHDFEAIVPALALSQESPVRFIFPHAPMRRITINNGMKMRGWYDVTDLPIDTSCPWQDDREGIEQSADIVHKLIARENQRGIATEKIFLAGFSQGGAIALFTALRLQTPLAGIIALSTYLPDATTLESEKSAHNQNTPIFMGHGSEDPLIPLSIATQSYRLLIEQGYNVEWHTYAMPHSLHPNEIEDIASYLKKHLTHSLLK